MSQDLINKVYMEAMKLKDSSLSEIELREKLVQMGYPEDLAEYAAKDIQIERNSEKASKSKQRIYLGIALIILGALIMIGSILFTDGWLVFPQGIIFFGILYIIWGFVTKNRR